MADPELEAIRQQRLQQMQGSNPDQQKAMQEQRQAQEEMKNSMLAQLLDQDARARLNTLKLSKPEKAQIVEANIIRMAQMGQFGDKLDDASLVKLLENLNKQMPRSNSTVKFDRRRAALDSDEEDDDYGI
ncbi:programmed cell death protein 5 [Anopheles marshallii]|uniref:programmed cell death protein 5 n=1 Tax=Anopheles marshallii TaxID=1521116 RepID=UPI00237AEB31|nr:programmed cell death protein 5 [Anopheles marshallii]